MRGNIRSNRRKRARERVARAEARRLARLRELAQRFLDPIRTFMDYDSWSKKVLRTIPMTTEVAVDRAKYEQDSATGLFVPMRYLREDKAV